MSPDESLLRSHLEEASYRIGAARNHWGLHVDIEWPAAIFWCKTEIKSGELGKIFLRFNLEGYPQAAPTACPWDLEKNQKLAAELWPKGTKHIQNVFNTGNAHLYAPCDRKAIGGHPAWVEQHKAYTWTSDSTIVKYLRFVFELLNAGAE